MAFEAVTEQAIQAQDTPQPDNQTQSEPATESLGLEGASGQPVVTDLSKLQKFSIDGKEYSYDQLKQERLKHEDYTRKTQEVADERRKFQTEAKYASNYRSDLRTVRAQPWKAAEFYKLYPDEYHDEVKWIEQMYKSNPAMWSKSDGQPAGQPGQTKQEQPDVQELVERLISSRLKPFEEEKRVAQEKTMLAQMDSREVKLKQKYPNANQFEVYAAAEFLAKGDQDNPDGRELTEADWDRVFRDSHERTLKSFKDWQAVGFKQQTQANRTLKDVQGGGGIPGEAPVVAKNIKQATQMFMKGNGAS